jgi:hypothetical protein
MTTMHQMITSITGWCQMISSILSFYTIWEQYAES